MFSSGNAGTAPVVQVSLRMAPAAVVISLHSSRALQLLLSKPSSKQAAGVMLFTGSTSQQHTDTVVCVCVCVHMQTGKHKQDAF